MRRRRRSANTRVGNFFTTPTVTFHGIGRLVDRFLETGVRALAAKRQIGPQPGASLGAGI
jgi:hypothetical protein